MAASLEFFIEPKVKSTSMSKIAKITQKAKGAFKGLNTQVNKSNRNFNTLNKKTKMVGLSMKSLVKGILLTASTYLGLGQVISGVNLASEVDETNNKLEAVFGDMTSNVRMTMRDITKELKLGETEITKEFANIGAIFKGLGFEGDVLVNNTESLLKAALDAASFHNLDFQRSIGAIRGAMLGESEALKATTGIIVQEDPMKEYAKGIGIVWKNLNVAQKAQLRFNFIMEQLQKQNASGDLMRTRDSFENVRRSIKQLTTDIKAGFFKQLKNDLLPNMINLREFLIDNKDQIIAFGTNFRRVGQNVGEFFRILKPALSGSFELSMKIFKATSGFFKEHEENFKVILQGIVSFVNFTINSISKAIEIATPLFKLVGGITGAGIKTVRFISEVITPGASPTLRDVDTGPRGRAATLDRGITGTTVNNFNTRSERSRRNTNVNNNITINGGLDPKGLERKVKRVVDEHNRESLVALGGA